MVVVSGNGVYVVYVIYHYLNIVWVFIKYVVCVIVFCFVFLKKNMF